MGHDVIRKEALPFYRTIPVVRLCWGLDEPTGPKGILLDSDDVERIILGARFITYHFVRIRESSKNMVMEGIRRDAHHHQLHAPLQFEHPWPIIPHDCRVQSLTQFLKRRRRLALLFVLFPPRALAISSAVRVVLEDLFYEQGIPAHLFPLKENDVRRNLRACTRVACDQRHAPSLAWFYTHRIRFRLP